MNLSQPSEDIPLTGSRAAIDTLLRLVEDAFEADPKHSVLANLRELRDEEWTALLPGYNQPESESRTIAEIVEHVAWVKWMYEDYAFGSASLAGDRPPLVPANGARSRPRDELLAWLADGHRRLRASIEALADDGELDRIRLTYWGGRLPMRSIIHIVIAHDYYHAGEINHLRARLQGTDHWPDR